MISCTALTIDEGYGGLAGGRQLDILGGSGGGKSNSECRGRYNRSTDDFLICEEPLEWDTARLLEIMFILCEVADNVEVLTVVTLEAVFE